MVKGLGFKGLFRVDEGLAPVCVSFLLCIQQVTKGAAGLTHLF